MFENSAELAENKLLLLYILQVLKDRFQILNLQK